MASCRLRGRVMISTRVRSLSFSCVLFVTGPALAEEVGVRKFPVPQQGVFQLQVPKSWKDGVSQPPGSTTPTIVLTGGGEEAFEVSLTPRLCCKSRQPRSVELEFVIIESGYARF